MSALVQCQTFSFHLFPSTTQLNMSQLPHNSVISIFVVVCDCRQPNIIFCNLAIAIPVSRWQQSSAVAVSSFTDLCCQSSSLLSQKASFFCFCIRSKHIKVLWLWCNKILNSSINQAHESESELELQFYSALIPAN